VAQVLKHVAPTATAAADTTELRKSYEPQLAGHVHRTMRLRFVIVIAAALLPAVRTETAEQLPQAKSIIERAVAAAERSWSLAPEYAFLETDGSHEGTRTYEVTMMLGSPYRRLVRVNGEPLSPSRKEAEQQTLERELATRRAETPEERTSRLRVYQSERERDRVMLAEMPSAFDFSLVGRQTVDGRDVYVLDATPRSDYRPTDVHAKALTGMRGRGSIDVKTFNWVKLSAQVVRPVSIAGFLARVEPGTSFELEQVRVDDGIWLPKHYVERSNSRILGLFSRNEYDEETYSNYRKMASSPDDVSAYLGRDPESRPSR
jgi:hypothetical protein